MADIASIGIKVETSGVDRGIKSLDSLASQGKKTEQALNSMSTTVQKNSSAVQRASSGFDGLAKSAGNAGSALASVSSYTGVIGSALGALGLATSVAELGRMADASTNVASRLKLVTDSAVELALTQSSLFKVAQDSRVSFTDLADTYAQMARSTKELGVSQRDMLQVTKVISQAVTISGGSAESAKAALIQLSQGFASGALRGEELNSVMEQTPRLAQAIANGLGVGIGKLREMGSAGELTAEKVLGALLNSAGSVQKEFDQMAVTIEQASTRANNSLVRLVGVIDNISGASATAASGISRMASGLDSLSANLDSISKSNSFSDFIFLAFNNQRSLNGELEIAQKELDRLAAIYSKAPDNIYIRSQLVEMREYVAEIKEAQARLAALSGMQVPTGAGGGRGSVNPQTTPQIFAAQEKSEKALADIRMRAAGINKQYFEDLKSYQDALKNGTITQDQYVKGVSELAKRTLDASAAGKEAAKALKANGSAGVSEIANIQARVYGVQQNIEMLKKYGSAADKITEGEKLAYKIQQEIDSGKLKSSQLLVKQKELEAAKSLQSAQESLIAEEKRLKGQKLTNELLQDSIGYNEDFIEQWNLLSAAYDGTEEGLRRLTAAQAKLIADQPFSKMERSIAEARNEMELFEQSLTRASQRELEQIGVGGIPLQRMQRQNQVDDQIRSRREQLASNKARDTASAGGTLPENLAKYYETQEQAITDMYSRITLANGNAFDQMLAKQGDWKNGAKAAFEDYAATVQNVSQQTNDLFSSAFSSMESALVNFITTGKFEFKSFATSIIADLAKIEAKKLVLSAATGLRSILGFADGGYTGDGGKYEAAGIVHRGEVVWSQSDVARAGGVNRVESMRLRGYANGGIVGQSSSSSAPVSSGNVSVMVNIDQGGGATVDTKAQGEQARKLGDLAGVAVRDALMRERRQGGILWNMKNGR